MPSHAGPFESRQEKPQVALDHVERERLVRHRRVHAEAALIGTPETADHRHDLDHRGSAQSRLDELPALLHTRQVGRLSRRAEVPAHRSMRRALAQDLLHQVAIGEAHHVVEVLLRVTRICAGVRPAEHRDGPARLVKTAQGIRQLGRLRERADEDQVERVGERIDHVLVPAVVPDVDVVPLLLAPDRHDLGHDARQVRAHRAGVQGATRRFPEDIDDRDAEFAHESRERSEYGRRLVGASGARVS